MIRFRSVIKVISSSCNTRLLPTIYFSEMAGSVESSIRKKLSDIFKPDHLEVLNESYMHSVPKGSETHFKVVIVSQSFDGQALIKRHRSVNDVLKEELESGVHALSIMAKTPSQWESGNQAVQKSPPCLGGNAL